jgi:hypothetical protein
MTRIGFLPVDFQKSCDCEWLCLWTYLVPATAKEKEEAFANLSTVGEEDLSPHAPTREAFRS